MRSESTMTVFPSVHAVAKASAAGVAIAIVALACGDAPTKPSALTGVVGSMSAAVSSADSRAAPLIDDASGRLSAAMEDAITRDRVRELLRGLSSALADGNATNAHAQITRLRKIIDARAEQADGADLAALGLALDQIELQLNGDATTNP
jgi:hypothetical protein